MQKLTKFQLKKFTAAIKSNFPFFLLELAATEVHHVITRNYNARTSERTRFIY